MKLALKLRLINYVIKGGGWYGRREIIKKREVRSVPERMTETRKVVVPKTVMEEHTVQEPKTVMRERVYEKWVAVTCDKISGMEVMDPSGEKIGSISDVMIDLDSGRILYAVLKFGGWFNRKSFALPWEAFKLANRERYYDEEYQNNLVLNIPKERFEEAEGFDEDNWPRQPDRSWLSKTYSRYGYRGWWEDNTRY